MKDNHLSFIIGEKWGCLMDFERIICASAIKEKNKAWRKYSANTKLCATIFKLGMNNEFLWFFLASLYKICVAKNVRLHKHYSLATKIVNMEME